MNLEKISIYVTASKATNVERKKRKEPIQTLYEKDSIDKNIRIERRKSFLENELARNPSFLSYCQNLFDQGTHTGMTRVKKRELVSSYAGGIHLFTAYDGARESRETARDKSESRFRNLFISPCVAIVFSGRRKRVA